MMTTQSLHKNPFASTSLFISDLSSNTTESTLFDIFNEIRPVCSVRICRDSTSLRSLGYGYINYHTINDAERALNALNFSKINGKPCRVMWSQRTCNLRQSEANIFVKHLHKSIDDETLYKTFCVFGSILSCKVMKNRGYGYVQYVKNESALKAIANINDIETNIFDQQIHAEIFKPRSQRLKTFTNVYVKYIPLSFNQDTLRTLFESETGGTITHLTLWRHPFGLSACLNFDDAKDANTAVKTLNGRCIIDHDNAKKLYVARAQKKQERKEYLRKLQLKKANRTRYFNKTNGNRLYNQLNTVQPMQYMHNIATNNYNMHLLQRSIPRAYHSQPMQSVYNIASVSNLGSMPASMKMGISSVPNVSAPMIEMQPLNAEMLLKVNRSERKRLIGERLFGKIQAIEPRLAGKITGMLLKMDNTELLVLLSNDKALVNKINEALYVLKEHQRQQSLSNISNKNIYSTPNNESAPN